MDGGYIRGYCGKSAGRVVKKMLSDYLRVDKINH